MRKNLSQLTDLEFGDNASCQWKGFDLMRAGGYSPDHGPRIIGGCLGDIIMYRPQVTAGKLRPYDSHSTSPNSLRISSISNTRSASLSANPASIACRT